MSLFFLVILLSLIIIVGVLYGKIVTSIRKKMPNLRTTRIYQLLGIYIAVLVIVTGVYFIFIQQQLPKYNYEEAEKLKAEREYTEDINDYKRAELLYDQKELSVEEGVFHLRTSIPKHDVWDSRVFILVERTEDRSNKVKTEHYTGRGDITIPNFIDITDELPHGDYIYEADGIIIVENKVTEVIPLIFINKPFIYKQFQEEGKSSFDISRGYGMGVESEVLRVIVPENIELIIDEALEEIVEIVE